MLDGRKCLPADSVTLAMCTLSRMEARRRTAHPPHRWHTRSNTLPRNSPAALDQGTRLMKQNGLLAATAVCAALVLPGLGAAQTAPATPPSPTAPATRPVQVPIPKTAAEVPGPVPGNTMTERVCPVRRPHGLPVGLSDGERAQPPCGICRSTRARTAGRRRAGRARRLQPDADRLPQAGPDPSSSVRTRTSPTGQGSPRSTGSRR